MKTVAFFISLAALVMAGCASKKTYFEDDRFELVHFHADKCVEKLSKLALENKEPFTFSYAYYISSLSVPMINALYTQSEKRPIPYFIAPARDNNNSGSAWRTCMSEHSVLDSNIIFPKNLR